MGVCLLGGCASGAWGLPLRDGGLTLGGMGSVSRGFPSGKVVFCYGLLFESVLLL